MTLFNFPSNFVYWTKIKDHEELKNILLPKIYADVPNIKYEGDGVCVTNYFEENNIINNLDFSFYESIVWNPFKKMYDEPDLKLRYSPEKSSIQNIWYNLYDDKNSWHKTHTHPTSTFSGIYLLHLTGENGTTFYQFGHPMYELEYDTKHIEEGNVIIFPSAMPHSIVSKDHKVSISFNIQCYNDSYGSLF